MPERTRAISAGKRDSRRHSTTSFGENVLVVETGNQIGKIINLRPGEGLTSFNKDNSAKCFGEKNEYNEALRGVSFLRIRENQTFYP